MLRHLYSDLRAFHYHKIRWTWTVGAFVITGTPWGISAMTHSFTYPVLLWIASGVLLSCCCAFAWGSWTRARALRPKLLLIYGDDLKEQTSGSPAVYMIAAKNDGGSDLCNCEISIEAVRIARDQFQSSMISTPKIARFHDSESKAAAQRLKQGKRFYVDFLELMQDGRPYGVMFQWEIGSHRTHGTVTGSYTSFYVDIAAYSSSCAPTRETLYLFWDSYEDFHIQRAVASVKQ